MGLRQKRGIYKGHQSRKTRQHCPSKLSRLNPHWAQATQQEVRKLNILHLAALFGVHLLCR